MQQRLWDVFLFTNMAPLTNEDKILIKPLRLEKGWSVLRMKREFPLRKMKWFPFSAGRSAGTPSTPHCHLPALPCAQIHWTGKLAAKQSRFKSCGLFIVGALQQMVYHYKISDIDQLKRVLIDCWAQLSQDMLNRANDQLPKRPRSTQPGYPSVGRRNEYQRKLGSKWAHRAIH